MKCLRLATAVVSIAMVFAVASDASAQQATRREYVNPPQTETANVPPPPQRGGAGVPTGTATGRLVSPPRSLGTRVPTSRPIGTVPPPPNDRQSAVTQPTDTADTNADTSSFQASSPATPRTSFWQTAPGFITAAGGFLGAIAALITAIRARDKRQ